MAEFELLVIIVFLVAFLIYAGYAIGRKVGETVKEHELARRIPDIRSDAIKSSRATLVGQFSEQVAPYFPGFPYSPSEARFIGKPVDFIIFRGMDVKDINEVVFVEVKSGKSSLSPQERKLRDIIKKGNVSWAEYRMP